MTDTMNAATEKAAEVKDTATEKATEVKDTATAGAAAVAQEAKTKAMDVFGQTKQQLTQEANTQGQRLASSLQDVSRQLSTMAQGGEAGPVQDLASQAADALGSFANRLQGGGTDGLLRDLSGLARRKPGAFLLGAGVAGFVVTRLVRNGAMNSSTPSPKPLPGGPSPSSVSGSASSVPQPSPAVPPDTPNLGAPTASSRTAGGPLVGGVE